MRLTVDHAALAPALAIVARVVPARAVRPILTSILLSVEDGALAVAATDLETSVVARVPATVEEEGRAALPARYLADMMRRIPGGLLALSTEEEGASAQVSWGRSRFTIQGHRPEDFPSIGGFPEGDHRTLPQGLLRRCIAHTAFAAAQGETARALLTGVELRLGTEAVFALATDGFQAASYATHPNVARPVDGAMVVPAGVLTEVARLLEDSEEPCDVAQQGNHVMFRCGAVHLTARLLEGKYFDLLGLVPREFPTVVKVDRETLLGACERVGIVAEAEAPHAITMDLTDDGMRLGASRADVGSAQEDVSASVSGPAMHMGFNVRQMIEGLRRFEGREVRLEISGPLSLTRWTDSDDGKFQYLQMPLQMPE